MSDDTTPEPDMARREKLSRERLLLLADMTADFRDDPFGEDNAGPVRPDEDPTT